MGCSAVVQFLTVAQAEPQVDSVRRAALPDNFPAAVAPCTPRVVSPVEAPQERPALALASDRVLVARVLALADHAPAWARPDSFLLRGKLRVDSGRVAHRVVAARLTRRVMKAR